jgi:hypothetical protein
MKRLRPTLIALAILALSATAVFAAAPGRPASAPESHHPKASDSARPSEAPEATEKAEATEADEPTEGSKPGDGAEAGHPVNHGCVVSLAAKTATPSGFKNHGKWVSSIAKDNQGHNPGSEPSTCALPAGSPAPSAP